MLWFSQNNSCISSLPSYDMYWKAGSRLNRRGLHVCCDDKDAVWKARRMARRCERLLPWTLWWASSLYLSTTCTGSLILDWTRALCLLWWQRRGMKSPRIARRCEPLLPWTLLMGIISLPSYEMYWMTKARYEKLSQYIHLADNSAIPNTPRLRPTVQCTASTQEMRAHIPHSLRHLTHCTSTASTRDVRAHIAHSLCHLTHCTRYGLYSRRASAHSAFTTPPNPLYKVRPLLETCERTFRIHYAT